MTGANPDETMIATTTVKAPVEAVFGALADPSTHSALDGTGWVRGALDEAPITAAGQVFRVAMHHENHPDGDYEIANLVRDFDPPRLISWEPGQPSKETGKLETGGWVWRYDLAADGPDATRVTLTYDWSAVPQHIREYLSFPPFGQEYLDESLNHLGEIVTG